MIEDINNPSTPSPSELSGTGVSPPRPTNQTQSTSMDLSHCWRTRDSIYSLLQSRAALLKQLNIAHGDDAVALKESLDKPPLVVSDIGIKSKSIGSSSSSSGKKQRRSEAKKLLSLSSFYSSNSKQQQSLQTNKFEFEKYIDEMKNDENSRTMVQKAFEIAAINAIQGLKQQHQQQKQLKQRDNEHNEQNETNEFSNATPSFLQMLDKMNETKVNCFNTAIHHDTMVKTFKSLSKRNLTISNPAAAALKSSSTAGRKRKLNQANNNNDGNDDDITDAKKRKKGKNDDSLNFTSDTTVISRAGTNKKNNANATSTADVRLLTSRAILCSAASIVFKDLTPNYQSYHSSHNAESDNDEDENVDENEMLDLCKYNNIDALNVPQNPNYSSDIDSSPPSPPSPSTITTDTQQEQIINMGAVKMSAEIFSTRTMEQVVNCINKSERRRKFRMDCTKCIIDSNQCKQQQPTSIQGASMNDGNLLKNYLFWNRNNTCGANNNSHCVTEDSGEEEGGYSDNDDFTLGYQQSKLEQLPQSEEWTKICLPRIHNIMKNGPGHVIVHDMEWKTRFQRVMDILRVLSEDCSINQRSELFPQDYKMKNLSKPNYGPHLIITTQTDYGKFLNAIEALDYKVSQDDDKFYLRSLGYAGSAKKCRRLRMEHFNTLGLSGQKDAPYNVVVTTYSNFARDYLHFCHIAFQGVILDDGMSWLGTANYDPNGQFGKAFDKGMWNQSDNHAGSDIIGTWDFGTDVSNILQLDLDIDEKKQILIGLTARHRIIIASSLHSTYRNVTYSAPVPGLLSFLIPQFSDVVKEEWDRSRAPSCDESMEHMRKLVCRSIAVYTGSHPNMNLHSLALLSMTGRLNIQNSDLTKAHIQPDDNSDTESTNGKDLKISTDTMINHGKIVQSRRFAACWLQPNSAIRYELGTISLDPILNAIKFRAANGYVCEETATASSLTSNGAGGSVTGKAAYNMAVRCGRSFSSEQALRQHIAALHAPPGTWLCRSCGSDCGTSQARTHHERACGANSSLAHLIPTGSTKENPLGGVIPTVGQLSKKKKTTKSGGNVQMNETKDEFGCIPIPGFCGVWVNPKGKHFVKIDGNPLKKEGDEIPESDSIILFDSPDEAALFYDSVLKKEQSENTEELKLNFKADGSRIVYDTTSTAAAGRNLEMLGGGASSVVPALSVINIKDLPKGVVPLLRDPRQTPRTGGNSKRYIYAYRGVCRQARKGHDRWQSQISFGGTNHYLGTFDSEWDAAAIYAWAHLILYGEEATKKAQEEGEQAVASYEKEQKDIAEGKMPAVVASPCVKKKKPKGRAKPAPSSGTKSSGAKKPPKKIVVTDELDNVFLFQEKKALYKKMSGAFHRVKDTIDIEDTTLMSHVTSRILASRKKQISLTPNVCIPVSKTMKDFLFPSGRAMLVGLSPQDFGWDFESFLESSRQFSDNDLPHLSIAFESEFGDGGINSRFCSVIQGFPCIIGKASKHLEEAALTLGLYGANVGGTIGEIDCNIGGIGSCSEKAVVISGTSESLDLLKVNICDSTGSIAVDGNILVPTTTEMSSMIFTVGNKSIFSIGSRVFMLITNSHSIK